MKIAYPANNKYIVESKSIKLYLNSFNMDFNIAAKLYNELKVFIDNDNQQGWAKFDISQFLTWRELKQRFKDIEDKLAPIDGICEFFMAYRVALDLSKLLETKVSVVMIAADTNSGFDSDNTSFEFRTLINKFVNIDKSINSKDFSKVYEVPAYVESDGFDNLRKYVDDNKQDTVIKDESQGAIRRYHSSILKSNCRVTSQPDWGDIYITIDKDIKCSELLKYIISFRDECHFHEEICETVFVRLKELFDPKVLVVECLYARRGGIDINPVRSLYSSHISKYSVLNIISSDSKNNNVKTIKQ